MFGVAARSRMVELSRLCLEGQLGAKVMESAVFGAAAQSRSGGFCCVRSGSSELKWDLAVLGAAAQSQMVQSAVL